MQTKNVRLPSGAVIEMRKLGLREENYLASAARSKKGSQDQVLIEVVSLCTNSVIEPGPYPHIEAGKKPDWNEMLAGDWFAAMIELRKFSYREGSSYEIRAQCPSRACNNRFAWKVDLDKDLFVKELPEESAEALKEGKPLEARIADRIVRFHLGFVKDAQRQEKLERRFPNREMACMFRSRIAEVEGIDQQDIMSWLDGESRGKEPSQYEGLCSDDAEDLRAAFEEADCGVDTEVELECPRSMCREFFTLDLPFDRIFTPARADKQRRERRERRAAGSARRSED